MIERKPLPDLVDCIGAGRERFEREPARLAAYRYRVVIMEVDWRTVKTGDYRNRIVAEIDLRVGSSRRREMSKAPGR